MPIPLQCQSPAFELPACLFEGHAVVAATALEAKVAMLVSGLDAAEEYLEGLVKPLQDFW